MDKGSYKYELINSLEIQINEYEGDRETYLGNQNETGTVDLAIDSDRAERFAQAVLKNTEQLIPVQEIDDDLSNLQYEINKPTELNKQGDKILNLDLPWEEKRKLLWEEVLKDYSSPKDEDSPLRLVWENFMIDLSWDAVGKIEEGASRI